MGTRGPWWGPYYKPGLLAGVVIELSSAVQCKSQAPPDLLKDELLAHPVAYIEDSGVSIGVLRADQSGDGVVCARKLPVRAVEEFHGLLRVVGVELGLE